MNWTEKDEETVRQCQACAENCRHYHLQPAPWFELCLRMHGALREAGLLERRGFSQDYCDECAFAGGGCRKAYREAVLDESRSRVVFCKGRVTRKQQDALERAAERKKRRSAS